MVEENTVKKILFINMVTRWYCYIMHVMVMVMHMVDCYIIYIIDFYKLHCNIKSF